MLARNFMAIDEMVYRPALFKVTQGKTKIGKVVRGTDDLWCSVSPGAHILISRKSIFLFRYINFASIFYFRRDIDPSCHSSRDLETVRFWTICPSYIRERRKNQEPIVRKVLVIPTRMERGKREYPSMEVLFLHPRPFPLLFFSVGALEDWIDVHIGQFGPGGKPDSLLI